MKVGALIALILAVLSMVFSLSQYALVMFGIHNPLMTNILWPLSIFLHGLPVIILSITILATSKTSPPS